MLLKVGAVGPGRVVISDGTIMIDQIMGVMIEQSSDRP